MSAPAGHSHQPGRELDALVHAAGLPEPIAGLLHRIAEEGTERGEPLTPTRELIEELIDHFASGLAAGVDSAELVRRFARQGAHEAALVAAARQRRARLDSAAPRRWAAMSGWGVDLRAALHGLVRRPVFALGNIATLALGIGAAVALFALFETILLRPLPYAQPDQLHYVREQSADGRRLYPSYPNFDDWRQQTQIFDGVVSTTWGGWTTVLGADRPLRVRSLGVSRDFFEVLGVRPIVGRAFLPAENAYGGPPVAMVCE
jgi:hypothetical protein